MLMKNKHDQNSGLPIEDLVKLNSIFENKNWPIQDQLEESFFDNFCNMLETLESDERNLLIALTENFLWVQDGEYIAYFMKSFNKFVAEFQFDGCRNICICPLLPEADFGKPKSSVMLLYMIKANLSSIQKKYSKKYNICYVDSPNDFVSKFNGQDFILCLIDDFIGSGETVESAMLFLLESGVSINQIAIISLVGMKDGIDRIKNNGYHIFISAVCNKGISSFEQNVEEIRSIMERIEAKIKVKDEYKFGYRQSEALVKMIRTPNNTFPIYWLRNKKNKYAPFPR